MQLATGTRPSPAIVISAIALCLALAGTAIAGPDALTRAVTKAKVKQVAKKQANKVVDQREGALNVNSAKSAETAKTAETAQTAQTAANAETAANANQVGGLPANGLARATTATSADADLFDNPNFTNLIARQVSAPGPGILLIWGQVNVNRDVATASAALLNVRATVDGAAATTEVNVRATEDGSDDQSASVSGAVSVPAGTHTVSLQAREVGPGGAFLTERSVTTLFVPFGNAGTPGVLSPEPRGQNE